MVLYNCSFYVKHLLLRNTLHYSANIGLCPKNHNDKNIEDNKEAPRTSTATKNKNTVGITQGGNKLQTGNQSIETRQEMYL